MRGVSKDDGPGRTSFEARAVIGLRFARTRWLAPQGDGLSKQPGDLGDRNLPLREHEFFGLALPFAIAGRKRVLRGEAVIEDEPRI